jgi:CDP-paratose synthetase
VKILITGATGFIGIKLVKRFLLEKNEVAILTRTNTFRFPESIKIFSGKLDELSESIQSFDPGYVFHLAGNSIYPQNDHDLENLWEANELFGVRLLEILKKCKKVVFVNFNTSLAYQGVHLQPHSYYGLTKANFIQTLAFITRKTTLRVFNLILYNVYGAGDTNKRALNYIVDSLEATNSILMSPGEQVMDFIHVDDVIQLCIELLKQTPNKLIEDIHVGTGRGITLKEASELMSSFSEQQTNIQFGGLPYREDEKMVNIAPIENNRFWKSTITIEKGFLSLLQTKSYE